jgi:lysozyme
MSLKNYNGFINFLVKFEGLRTTAYQDQVGVWTIGIGSTFHKDSRPVKKGDKITIDEAYELAELVAADFYNQIKDAVNIEQTEQQWWALLSLTYNIGVGAFKKSTLVKRINEKKSMVEIEQAFMMWVKAGGKVLPALVTRRKAEFKLYNSK